MSSQATPGRTAAVEMKLLSGPGARRGRAVTGRSMPSRLVLGSWVDRAGGAADMGKGRAVQDLWWCICPCLAVLRQRDAIRVGVWVVLVCCPDAIGGASSSDCSRLQSGNGHRLFTLWEKKLGGGAWLTGMHLQCCCGQCMGLSVLPACASLGRFLPFLHRPSRRMSRCRPRSSICVSVSVPFADQGSSGMRQSTAEQTQGTRQRLPERRASNAVVTTPLLFGLPRPPASRI